MVKSGLNQILSLSFILLVSSCAKFVEPELLANNVLEAFQKKDVEIALPFLMYEDDYEGFFAGSQLNQKEKDRLISKHTSPDYIEKRIERFKKRFKEILEQGEAEGIIWSEIKFEFIEGPKKENYMGLQADEIYVNFSFRTTIYKLRLDDCYRCPRGWLMSDEPSFEGAVSNE